MPENSKNSELHIITIDDARAKGLPGLNSADNDFWIYHTRSALDLGALHLCINARTFLDDSILFTRASELHLEQIEYMQARGGEDPFGFMRVKMTYTDEAINFRYLEYIKIAGALELFCKARLLAGGFVVHKVREKGVYANLYKEHRQRPIAYEEFVAIRDWQYSVKESCIDGLSNQSIGFKTIVTVEKYVDRLGLDASDLIMINEWRKRRNKIHYMTPFYFSEGREWIKKASEEMVSFYNREMVEFSNMMLDKYKLPMIKRFEPVHLPSRA